MNDAIYSVYDQLSDKLSSAMLQIQDKKNRLSGSESSLLRISSDYQEGDNLGGDTVWTLESQLVNNIHLRFPLSDVEYFNNLDGEDYEDNPAIDLWDILPITGTMYQRDGYEDVFGNLKKNDLLIRVLFDQGRKLPLIMKITKVRAHAFGRQIIRKTLELVLARETLEDEIQTVVDEYVSTLGVPSVESTIPTNGSTGVPTTQDISIQFNMGMKTTEFVSGMVTFSPALIDSSYVWSNSGEILTVSDNSGLVASTDYIVTVTDKIESKYGVNLPESYNFTFQTI
jgi:hypothetical protein